MFERRQLKLGVNIDHVATLRQARGTLYPDPTAAALRAEQAGADYITLHLREDRRHIQIQDVLQMKAQLQTSMNLEMAINPEMLVFAEQVRPRDCCLVPEKRAELTTEGGLEVVGQAATVKHACARLQAAGIRVSLFIDPDVSQIDAAKVAGADIVEIHTGRYANASPSQQKGELDAIAAAARYAQGLGLQVNAGHGLNYENTQALVAAVAELSDLNIGHAIIARALFVGIETAVIEMRNILRTIA